MSRLIALVATAVLVNGVRTVIQPGQELPEQNEHDEGELLANGAAMDPESAAATEKAKRQEEQWAAREFQEARERVMAERASTAPAEKASDPASTVVVDGEKTNTVFPDASELDRAHGQVSLSQLHQAPADASATGEAGKTPAPIADAVKATEAPADASATGAAGKAPEATGDAPKATKAASKGAEKTNATKE